MTDLLARFEANARANGFHVHRDAVPELTEAGLSRALYGLAETGSVVLAAAPDEPRAASLLPQTHISVLARSCVLERMDDLFAALGDDLPSSLAIVSGPSRSADIELVLALGVHGPAEVHVVLVDEGRNEPTA